jgi:hypothetical protein
MIDFVASDRLELVDLIEDETLKDLVNLTAERQIP